MPARHDCVASGSPTVLGERHQVAGRKSPNRGLAICRIMVGVLIVVHSFSTRFIRAADDNWPQWRGTLMTGVSPTANPPIAWSETTNIKWKVKIPGRGLSTPLVWGDQIFIQTAIPVAKAEVAAESPGNSASTKKEDAAKPDPAPTGPGRLDGPAQRGGRGMGSQQPKEPYQFVLLCLDRQTGKTVWRKVAREEVPHEGAQFDNTFASNSPVTDGHCVIAYFGSRGLHCYDMAGNLIWEKDLGQMKTKLSFGEGSSPTLFGDTVVVNWDNGGHPARSQLRFGERPIALGMCGAHDQRHPDAGGRQRARLRNDRVSRVHDACDPARRNGRYHGDRRRRLDA